MHTYIWDLPTLRSQAETSHGDFKNEMRAAKMNSNGFSDFKTDLIFHRPISVNPEPKQKRKIMERNDPLFYLDSDIGQYGGTVD